MASGIMNISLSALNASLSGMRTVQHNIANANTEGYHRQVLSFKATTPQFFGGGFYGTGVQVEVARRVYDDFLSRQAQNYQAQLSSGQAYASFSTQVDALLGGESSGLGQPIQAFFSAVNEVVNDPTSLVARQQMLSAGGNLAGRFNVLADGLQDYNAALNKEIANIASQINRYAGQIQSLNVQIASAVGAGGEPNDLLDQRDQAVAELNKLIGVTQTDQGDGTIAVRLARGQALVDGASVNQVVPVNNSSGQLVLAFDLPNTTATEIIPDADITGGRLGGLLAFRSEVLNPSISDLDTMAMAFSTAFNDQHLLGYALDGSAGGHFFTDLAGTGSTAAAKDIAVLISDPGMVAAASAPGIGDNANAVALAGLRGTAFITSGTNSYTLSDYNTNMVGRNASAANSADNNVTMYSTLYQSAYDAEQAVSGVNLDEEAMDLIRYQQAYQAAAKAIQTSTKMFEEVLNIIR